MNCIKNEIIFLFNSNNITNLTAKIELLLGVMGKFEIDEWLVIKHSWKSVKGNTPLLVALFVPFAIALMKDNLYLSAFSITWVVVILGFVFCVNYFNKKIDLLIEMIKKVRKKGALDITSIILIIGFIVLFVILYLAGVFR